MAGSLLKRLTQAGLLAFALLACTSPRPQQASISAAPVPLNIEKVLPGAQVVLSGEKATRPGQDFFGYVNGDWLNTFRLPPDKVSAGVAEDISEKSDEDVRGLIEEMVRLKPAPGTIGRKIADLYSSAMDEKTIEARGLSPLEPHLRRIRAVRTMDDLVALMGVIGYNSPIGISVSSSPADPDANAVWVSQAGLGMPHRGYYLSPGLQEETLRVNYRTHVAEILRLMGAPDPQDGARRIYELEKKIAEAHTDEDRSLSAQEALKTMSLQELKAYAPEFNWDVFLAAGGLSRAQRIVLTDQTAVADLAKLVGTIPLEDWKLWMEFHFVDAFAEYLPRAFADSYFDFFSKSLAGLEQRPKRWQWAVGLVNTYLGDEVGRIYVSRHFPAGHKALIDEIVANIRSAFEQRLRRLEWMDEATRQEALSKLAALRAQIGHPETWVDPSALTIEPGKLVENIYAVFEYDWNRMRDNLGKPVDRDEWPTPAHTVNAFYNPLSNTFTMPAGILQPPYFDPEADPAENYGGIGAVIGHEISHGFDDRGRQFDGVGRNRNWWTKETDARFLAKADALIDQYNAYCPFTDACVNGLGTLGENIGDLAGLEIAYAAWTLSLHGAAPPIRDGLTGDQRFFLAYARSYRGLVREELARAMLDGDSHAPNRYRVNGVVRNMDAWYAAFNIRPGDRLYLPPEQRIRIW